jgi:hypothetical protein
LLGVLAAGGLMLASRHALAQAPGQWQPPPAATPAATAAPPPTTPPMQAGGLTPPSSTPPPTTSPPGAALGPTTPGTVGDPSTSPGVSVEQDLNKAKEEDSGRGLTWVWLNVEGGFEHVGLQTFNVDEENFTAGFIESSSSGGVIGAGLGFRLLFLTLGGRARVGFFPAWQLFSVGGELGFHIPIGNLEPHFDFGFGYTALGSFSGAVSGANDAIDISGFDARVGAGLDYFITPVFSLGANVSWEFLALTRPGLSPEAIASLETDPNVESARAQALAAEGSGYGSAIAVTAVAGLHF